MTGKCLSCENEVPDGVQYCEDCLKKKENNGGDGLSQPPKAQNSQEGSDGGTSSQGLTGGEGETPKEIKAGLNTPILETHGEGNGKNLIREEGKEGDIKAELPAIKTGKDIVEANREKYGQSKKETEPGFGEKDEGKGKSSEELKSTPIFHQEFQTIPINNQGKLREVFVPPADFEAITVEANQEKTVGRIFLIYGQEHSGKYIAAFRYGELLCSRCGASAVMEITRSPGSRLPMVRLALFQEFERKHVYLIRNAFEGENCFTMEELSDPSKAKALNQLLAEKNCALILTTRKTLQDFGPLDEVIYPLEIELERIDIQEVFTKHRTWYEGQEGAAVYSSAWDKLDAPTFSAILSKPYQIDAFFRALSRFGPHEDINQILATEMPGKDFYNLSQDEQGRIMNQALQRLAKRISQPLVEPTRQWFDRLAENARLYAMLIKLLSGVERELVDIIYSDLEQALRKDGVTTLVDSRQIGRDDLLEMIHAVERENHWIEFSAPAYAEEVERQIDNRHGLLWALVGLQNTIIEQFWNQKYKDLQAAFGRAIGSLGSKNFPKIEPLLELFAYHSRWNIVAIAGHSMAEACRRSLDAGGEALDLLKAWGRSGNFDLKSAAPSALASIYIQLTNLSLSGQNGNEHRIKQYTNKIWTLIENQIKTHGEFNGKTIDRALAIAYGLPANQYPDEEFLQKIYSSEFPVERQILFTMTLDGWSQTIRRSIVWAIMIMSTADPSNVIWKLTSWINGKADSRVREVGVEVAKELFAAYASLKVDLQKEIHKPLFDLVEPVLCLYPPQIDALNQVIETLAIWAQKEGWEDAAYQALLEAIHKTPIQNNPAIRKGVADFWISSAPEGLQEKGQKLLTATYFWDGTPCIPPEMNCVASLVVDTSRAARLFLVRESSCVLHAWMNARIHTMAFQMGYNQPISRLGPALQVKDFKARTDRSPLVMPLIEKAALTLNNGFQHPVVILSAGVILDAEELKYNGPGLPDGENNSRFYENVLSGMLKPDEVVPQRFEPLWLRQMHHASSEKIFSEIDLYIIDRNLQDHLAQQVGLEKPDGFIFQRFIKCFSLPTTPDILTTWLEERFDAVNRPGGLDNTELWNLLPLSILLLFYLAPQQAIQMLANRLHDTHKAESIVARSGIRLLYRVYAEIAPQDERRQTHVPILIQAVKFLAAKSGDEGTLRLITRAAVRWAVDAQLSEMLLGKFPDAVRIENAPFSQICPLPDLVDAIAEDNPSWLDSWISNILWDEISTENALNEDSPAQTRVIIPVLKDNLPTVSARDMLQNWPEKGHTATEIPPKAPESLKKMARQIQARLALGKGRQIPALGEGLKYCVIMIDSSTTRETDLPYLCESLFRELKEGKTELAHVRPLLFRLGNQLPAATSEQEITAQEIIPTNFPKLPALIAPILIGASAGQGIPPEQVAFVFIYTNGRVLDIEDLEEGWFSPSQRVPIFVYSQNIIVTGDAKASGYAIRFPAFVRPLSFQGKYPDEKDPKILSRKVAQACIRSVAEYIRG